MAQQKFQHPDGRGFSAEEGTDAAERLKGLGFAPVEEYTQPEAADTGSTPPVETKPEEVTDGGTNGDGKPADATEKADRGSGGK